MNSFEKIANRLKHESSFIFALLLIAGVVVLVRDPNSLIGIGLVIAASFIGILGFLINLIREGYDHILKQKDEMIKTLTRERRQEIKHSDDLRRRVESQATGGWESSATTGDDA